MIEPLSALMTIWLGTLFVYSASLKLARYDRAGSLLTLYGVLPRSLASATGFALPWVEMTAGFLLLFTLFPPAGALLGIFLGTIFAYAATRVLIRGSKVPCGCTGSDRDLVSRGTLSRALMIVGTASLLLALAPPNLPPLAATGLCAIAIAPSVGLAVRRSRAPQQHRHRHVEATYDELKRLRELLDSPATATSS